MATAIVGLIGVIIGGLLNAGVSLLVERRQRATAARVAARLVGVEMARNLWAARKTMETKSMSWMRHDLSDDQWRSHRQELAAVLGTDKWMTLASYYIGVEKAHGLVQAAGQTDAWPEAATPSLQALIDLSPEALASVESW